MQKFLLIALVFAGFEFQENSAETDTALRRRQPCREGRYCTLDQDCGEGGECGDFVGWGVNPGKCKCKPIPKPQPCREGRFCTMDEDCGESGECSAVGFGRCKCKPIPKPQPCREGRYCTLDEDCGESGECRGNDPRLIAPKPGKCKCKSIPKPQPCREGRYCTRDEDCGESGFCRNDPSNPFSSPGKCQCNPIPKPPLPPPDCFDGNKCILDSHCGKSGECQKAGWEAHGYCRCKQITRPTPPPPPPQYCIPSAKCRSNPVDDCGKYGRCTAPPGLMGATGLCICNFPKPPPPGACFHWVECQSDDDCGGYTGLCVSDPFNNGYPHSHCNCKACIQGEECQSDVDCGQGYCFKAGINPLPHAKGKCGC